MGVGVGEMEVGWWGEGKSGWRRRRGSGWRWDGWVRVSIFLMRSSRVCRHGRGPSRLAGCGCQGPGLGQGRRGERDT